MNRYLKALAALVLGGVLAACGGGGGSAGDTGTGGTGGTGGGTQTPVAATLVYELSSPTLSNTGNSSVTLTVTALDSRNNPVPDVPVTVSVDTGVFTPTAQKTDANGQYIGSISIGGNKANRTITATIQASGKTATAAVAVTGTQISLSPVPATVSPGGSTRIDIRVQDANGTGIANVPVQLSGTLGLTGTATTDVTGQVSATLAAVPTTPGTYTVIATAFGVQTTRSVQVIGGAGAIADAVGPISSASLAIVPNTIAPNTTGSTTNKAALRAKFLNGSNQAIQNVRVRFEIVPPGLGSGEQISTGTTVIYTDGNGEATADYVAGTRSSPTNGVVIRACYALTDAAIANGACPNQVTQTLTVASQPLSISLGDNNLLEKGNNDLTYIKKFDVAVVDSAGNAVPNAVISASVDITSYQKGLFVGPRVSCANEDTNRNGFLDVGEDINGSGALEPNKADITLSFLGSNTTGSNGRMAFQIEYAQNKATWLLYTIRATTNVAGSEGTVSRSFVTNYLQDDEENGSFHTPPYGTGACTSPN